MKLDNALTRIGKLCPGKNLSDDDICFSQLLTEGVPLKRDHWLSEFSATATIKFQIGIVSFSLRLSCQILVHRLGWGEKKRKRRRIGKKKKVQFGPWLSQQEPGFCFRFVQFFVSDQQCLSLFQGRIVDQCFMFLFFLYAGEEFGFKMTVSSNKHKGNFSPFCMSEVIVMKLAQ